MAKVTDPQEMIDNSKLEIGVPADDVFLLGVSELGTDRLAFGGVGGVDETYQWIELFCDSSEINIQRGFNMNSNIFGQAEASEMVAVVHNPTIDPFSNERISPNLPVRLSVLVDEEWEVLFVGWLRKALTKYPRSGPPSVTLTAYDDIQRLANIQAQATTSQSFSARLDALATVAAVDITTTGSTVTLAEINTYRSIWDIMNIAANSEGGFVYSNRQGSFEARGRSASAPSITIDFSDYHGAFTDDFTDEFQTANPLHACYTDIEISYDTSNVINSMNVTNISDVDSEGEDIEENVGVWTETSSINSYGESNLSVLTNLTDLSDVEDLKDYVFDTYANPARRVESLTFTPHYLWQTLVDVGDYVHVSYHKTDSYETLVDDDFMVTNVSHSISPGEWEIKLELWIGG